MAILADVSFGVMAGATIIPLAAAALLWVSLVRSEVAKSAAVEHAKLPRAGR